MHPDPFGAFINRAARLGFHLGLICWLLGILLPATPARSQQPTPTPTPAKGPDPLAYVKFGISNGMGGDLNAAIAAFNEAIKIDPKCEPAYENRGKAYKFQNKEDEALADFNQSILLNPNDPDAYTERGLIMGLKGNFDAALSDFEQVIKLSPKDAQAYYNSAHVKYFKGDLDGATSDLDKSIDLDSDFPFSYFIRGLIRHAQDNREGSATDFEKSSDAGFSSGAFWFWIVKMEAGERGTARQNLSDFLTGYQKKTPDDWIVQVANFLLEKTTQDQFLAAAKGSTVSKDHLCEAWFYIGISKRLAGDLKTAQNDFLQSVATGAKSSEEYVEAQRELTDLQKQ